MKKIREFKFVSRIKPWSMVIIATLLVFALICNMVYGQKKNRPTNEQIEEYLEKNEVGFNSLKDEIMRCNNHFFEFDQSNIPAKPETNN